MAITNAAVTVDTTAGGTLIWTHPAEGVRFGIIIQNNGAAALTIGAGTVTAANGILVPAASGGTPGSVVLDEVQDDIKGISASGSLDVRVFAWSKP